MKLLLSKFCFATAVAYAAFVTSMSAAVREVVARHKAELQPRGIEIFNATSAEYLHGVVLQSHATFVSALNQPIPAKDIQIDRYDEQSQKLILVHLGQTNSIKVPSEAVSRIASWIDNGGTSLFTEYEDMTPELAKDMGMSSYGSGCWVATEFAQTPYAKICHYFDFPADELLHTNCPQKLHNYIAWNDTFKGVLSGKLVEDDYIVSDLDSRFEIKLSGDKVRLSGTVYRYNRVLDPEKKKVFVYETEEFKTSDLSGALVTDDDTKLHCNALSFACLTAMLRTLHDENPTSWKAFESKFFDKERVN